MADLVTAPEDGAQDPADEVAPPVVTLFEQYGAGATAVGRLVAERLGVEFHAQAFSSDELEVEGSVDDQLKSRSELAQVLGALGGAYGGIGDRDIIATQQEKRDMVTDNNRRVRAFADDGGVIVGRNATVILASRPNTLHVLLTGEADDRVARAAKEADVPLERAAKRRPREDDVRAQMSKVLYGWDPLAPDRYDLLINTSRISIEAAAGAIVDMIKGGAR